MFPKVPQSSLGILRVPQLPPDIWFKQSLFDPLGWLDSIKLYHTIVPWGEGGEFHTVAEVWSVDATRALGWYILILKRLEDFKVCSLAILGVLNIAAGGFKWKPICKLCIFDIFFIFWVESRQDRKSSSNPMITWWFDSILFASTFRFFLPGRGHDFAMDKKVGFPELGNERAPESLHKNHWLAGSGPY